MISTKWLELYQYLQNQLLSLPSQQDVESKFNDRLMFLSAQFAQADREQDKINSTG
ncbi:hypothetical protein [Photobacterium leiognathi]|uniref:hypothetical protein n=1 Tax=Photobacterium leiognathi TaxID=553611 RepID=UPI000A993FBD|nr:hypothetical protein [Photobacterium leiognathi]